MRVLRRRRTALWLLEAALLVCSALRPAAGELVSHFTFDGTVEDQGPAGNDGVFFGGEPVYVEGYDGKPEGALSFDGIDDYVDVPHVNGLPIYAEQSFSITLWVKGLPQPDNRVFSESSSTSNTPLFNIGTDNTGNTGAVDIYIRGDSGVAAVSHWHSTATAFDDQWHHIAYIDDNGQVTIYIDGFEQQGSPRYARPVLTLDRTTIGAIVRDSRNPPECCHFAGAIDDVRLYNHALTKEEVFALLPEPPTCPDEGDTHCDGMEITGPLGGGPGVYSVSVMDAEDESGDQIWYTFTADNGQGTVLTVGPQLEINFADFTLSEGTWTISCTVDDDPNCPDVAPDATCTEIVEVSCPAEGDTHCSGLTVEGPPDNTPGTYLLTAEGAEDDSGDEILYIFTADNGVDPPLVVGPKSISNSIEPQTAAFTLGPGTWTLSVRVDDDPDCGDEAPDAVCSKQITVQEMPKQLISYFPFDGDLQDKGQAGNEAIFHGDVEPTFTEGFDGTPDGAILLDGLDDFVEVSQDHGLPITAHPAFTVCMWVKGEPTGPTPGGGTSADRRIFAEANVVPTERNPLFTLGTHSQGTNGAFDAFMRNDDGSVPLNHRRSAREVFDGQWHHIAWVQQDGSVILYIDGVRDSTDFNFRRGQMTFATTTIGGILRDVPSHFFNGAIDEVRLYNYALSQEEIEALVPEPPGCPDQGDTTCSEISITGPPDNIAGLYSVTAVGASDESGDPILYTFTAESLDGRYLQSGPDFVDSAEFFLMPGTWTISVIVDDDIRCRDQAQNAVCSEQIVVKEEEHLLLSHFTFDGTLEDSGAAGNDGVFHGGEPTFVEGYDGTPQGALAFDGIDDMVELTYNDGLPITSHIFFSIAMWVKGPTGQADRRVFSESSTVDNRPLFNIGTHNRGQGPQVDIYLRSDTGVQVLNHPKSQGSAFDDTWHHIAWVDAFGEATLYIDGVRDPTNFSYRRPQWTFTTTTIGGILRAAPSHWFTGAIDDVRIYNYLLSEEEIQELVTGQPPAEVFSRGDANDDGARNIADAIYILGYLFGGEAQPACLDAADTNDDGNVNVADAIALLGHLFAGTGPLPDPFPGCGADGQADDLPPCRYTHCP